MILPSGTGHFILFNPFCDFPVEHTLISFSPLKKLTSKPEIQFRKYLPNLKELLLLGGIIASIKSVPELPYKN